VLLGTSLVYKKRDLVVPLPIVIKVASLTELC
jgi:hypothetical protein